MLVLCLCCGRSSASDAAQQLIEAAVWIYFPYSLQLFFYKRAQIFVGDVYGAFGGKGLGCFADIDQLTMFADYRVPVVLRLMGLLQYSPELQRQVGGVW
jgi:hypothetical protein